MLVAADLPGKWLDVPFVKQEKDGCGAAAIAMVMQYWQQHEGKPIGSDSDANQIQRTLYSAKAHGIYASDMEKYFKEKGFRTFTIRGEWEDLRQHLDKGRPLIVALACPWRASTLRSRGRFRSGAGNCDVERSGSAQTAQAGPAQLRAGMERGWKMDLARSASNRSSLIPTIILTFLLFGNGYANSCCRRPTYPPGQTTVRRSALAGNCSLGKSAKNPSADFDFYYGTALAQLGRLAEVRSVRGGSQVAATGQALPPGAGWSLFQSEKLFSICPPSATGPSH